MRSVEDSAVSPKLQPVSSPWPLFPAISKPGHGCSEWASCPISSARAAVADLRRTVKRSEQQIANLNRRKADLERQLADPETYNGPTAALMDLQLRLGALKQEIAEAETAWLEAQTALEEN